MSFEYVALMLLVALGLGVAAKSLGVPLLEMHDYASTILLLPVP